MNDAGLGIFVLWGGCIWFLWRGFQLTFHILEYSLLGGLIVFAVLLGCKMYSEGKEDFKVEDIDRLVENVGKNEEYRRLYNVYKEMDVETLEEIAVRKDYKIEVNKIGMGIIAFATSVILFCINLLRDSQVEKWIIISYFACCVFLFVINYHFLTKYIGCLVWQRKIVDNVKAHATNGDIRNFFVTVKHKA